MDIIVIVAIIALVLTPIVGTLMGAEHYKDQ